MSLIRNKIIATLAAVSAAAALAPAASVADTGVGERTQAELGQAVGEPAQDGNAAANATHSRTPTELGQRVSASVAPGATSATTDPSGFDWGDAAIGAGGMLALIGLGGALAVVLANRRGHAIREDSRVPAVSS